MSDTKDISQVIDLSVQEYTNASFTVIKNLQAKVAKLETENESLLKMLEQNTPALIQTSDLNPIGIPHPQLICEAQICILKDAALTRALTMEECKKLEILTNVLQKYKVTVPSNEEIAVRKMTTEELVAAALADDNVN